jgi:uncharacterized membrane protein YgaE (UPF0421/DUF939 family)
MNVEEKYPKDFQEFLAQFSDENACWHYLIDIRGLKDIFVYNVNQGTIGLLQNIKSIVQTVVRNFR